MKPSNDLFDLVKHLSKAERIYFKRYSRLHVRGDGNNYILLFDAIAAQEKYDEEKLLKQFKGYDFTRRFAVAKNYLYNHVLYSMESFHHSIHSEIRSNLHRTEILYEKGLYKQAHKAVRKAKEIAGQHEMHCALLEILLVWEMKLAIKYDDMPWVKKINNEEKEILAALENFRIYRNLNMKMINLYISSGITRNKSHHKEVEKILNNKHFRDVAPAKTFKAKCLFYETRAFCAHAQGDAKEAYHHEKKLILQWESHPRLLKQNIAPYITWLNNLMDSCIGMGKYEEVSSCLDQLEKMSAAPEKFGIKSHSLKGRLFYFTALNRLGYYNATGRFSEAAAALSDIQNELSNYELTMSDYEKADLFNTIAVVFFGIRNFKSCLHWLNRIRNEIHHAFPPHLACHLRIFYLLVHYEAGNTDTFLYLIQSVERFLRKEERLYKFETIILYFFRNEIFKADTQKTVIQIFQKLKNKIILLAKDPYEKNAFNFFDYTCWVESKIENRPFAEMVRLRQRTDS